MHPMIALIPKNVVRRIANPNEYRADLGHGRIAPVIGWAARNQGKHLRRAAIGGV